MASHYNPDYWTRNKAQNDLRNEKIERYIKVVNSPDPDGRYANVKEHMIGILHEYPRTVVGSTRNEFELPSEEDFNNLYQELHSFVSRSGQFSEQTIDFALEIFLSIQNVKFKVERPKRGLFGGAYGRELILSEPHGLSYIHYRTPKANGNNVVLFKNGRIISEYAIKGPFDEVHNQLRRTIMSHRRARRSGSTRSPRSGSRRSSSKRSPRSRSR